VIIYKILWCKTEVEHYSASQEILIFDRSCKLINKLVNVLLDPSMSQSYPFFSLYKCFFWMHQRNSLYLSIGCIQNNYLKQYITLLSEVYW